MPPPKINAPTTPTVIGEFKEDEMVYHMAFFSAGLYAICKVCISTGMKESPEKMAEIIYDEYEKKKKFF